MTNRSPTRKFEARRAEIVTSAVAVLNRKGVKGMTLGEVAEKLQIAPNGLIYYFKNKDELARACFLNGLERLSGMLTAAQAAPTVAERVRRFLDAHFAFRRDVVEGRAEPLPVFSDVRALNAPCVNAAYVDMFRKVRGLLVGPETAALSRIELNARTYLLLSEVLWSTAWLVRRESEDYARVSGRVASVMLGGLATPGAPWAPAALQPSQISLADETGELFLRAGTALINEEGYAGASVERISARLNLTKGAFYHRNLSKDDLIQACFERSLEVKREAMRKAEALEGSAGRALASFAANLVARQVAEEIELVHPTSLSSAPDSLGPRLQHRYDRMSDRVASMICDGVADGSLRPVDVNIAAQMLLSLVAAAGRLKFWAPGVTPADAAGLYVRPFFEGLVPTSPA